MSLGGTNLGGHESRGHELQLDRSGGLEIVVNTKPAVDSL